MNLEDYRDIEDAARVLSDPHDAVLDWGEVRERLLAFDLNPSVSDDVHVEQLEADSSHGENDALA